MKKIITAPDGTKLYLSIDEAMLGTYKWGETFNGLIERNHPSYNVTIDNEKP